MLQSSKNIQWPRRAQGGVQEVRISKVAEVLHPPIKPPRFPLAYSSSQIKGGREGVKLGCMGVLLLSVSGIDSLSWQRQEHLPMVYLICVKGCQWDFWLLNKRKQYFWPERLRSSLGEPSRRPSGLNSVFFCEALPLETPVEGVWAESDTGGHDFAFDIWGGRSGGDSGRMGSILQRRGGKKFLSLSSVKSLLQFGSQEICFRKAHLIIYLGFVSLSKTRRILWWVGCGWGPEILTLPYACSHSQDSVLPPPPPRWVWGQLVKLS